MPKQLAQSRHFVKINGEVSSVPLSGTRRIDGYKELVKKVQPGLTELDFFIKRRTVEGYWRIGKFIQEHILKHQDRANYNSYLLENLADDVDRDYTTLSRALKFYRAFPILADQQELSGHHYKSLMRHCIDSLRVRHCMALYRWHCIDSLRWHCIDSLRK